MKIYFSVTETSEILGISRQAVLHHISKGTLPSVVNAQGHHRIEEDDIYELKNSKYYNKEKYYSRSEVAEMLKVSVETIKEYIKKGYFVSIKMEKGNVARILIEKNSVDEFIKNSKTKKIRRVPHSLGTQKMKTVSLDEIEINEDDYFTQPEAIKTLKVSRQSLCRYFNAGILTKFTKGSRVYVSKKEISSLYRKLYNVKTYVSK